LPSCSAYKNGLNRKEFESSHKFCYVLSFPEIYQRTFLSTWCRTEPDTRHVVTENSAKTLLHNFKLFMTTHRWFITTNTTNKCTYRYVNLSYFKQRALLHISATYCGHLRGDVIWSTLVTDDAVVAYSATSRHNTTTSVWMVSPYKQHINTKLNTKNFISIFYFKLLFKTWHFILVN
jgi:hypothetical protein